MISTSEENYIKAIYKLSHELKKEVTTSLLAEQLNTKASSVTDMIQKLAEKELVIYRKYQGTTLTATGEEKAVRIVRKHRLWELFLFQTLGFSWSEIHDIAEQLEHINSDALIERLDRFLNYPLTDPHGDPIPDENGNIPERKSVQLSLFPINIKGIVVGVNDKSSAFLIYLDKMGIKLGTEIEILELHEFDHSFDIRIDDLKLIHLSFQALQNILISEK